MADTPTGQERTEAATPRRRHKAREEGNVARSMEIVSVAVLVASLVGLAALGSGMAEGAGDLLRRHLTALGELELTPATAPGVARDLALVLAAILGPFVALVAVAGVGANVAQNGFLLTAKPLLPRVDRIKPSTGLKRIFSKRGLVEFAKSLVKIGVTGAVVGWTLVHTVESFLPLTSAGIAGWGVILGAMLRMASAAAVALALVAVLDFFFQRFDHEKKLMMTRQEVKEELKQNEGDPLLKSKVRQRQQEMSRRRMMEDVKTADVVVTNPVHYAVALQYEPARMNAPKVVAKGQRLLARRIRDVARAAGVPIIEDPPLARALFKACRVGGDVPLALYKAVAELLAFVYRRRGGAVPGGDR